MSEGGSESPSSSRFKVTVSPPASNSPIGSAKVNHVAKSASATTASNSASPAHNKTPEHVENGVQEAEEEENGPMQPREAIVRSVPSIELPDGKRKINSGKMSMSKASLAGNQNISRKILQ